MHRARGPAQSLVVCGGHCSLAVVVWQSSHAGKAADRTTITIKPRSFSSVQNMLNQSMHGVCKCSLSSCLVPPSPLAKLCGAVLRSSNPATVAHVPTRGVSPPRGLFCVHCSACVVYASYWAVVVAVVVAVVWLWLWLWFKAYWLWCGW